MFVNNYNIFEKIGSEYGLDVRYIDDDILFMWN